MTKVLLTGSTGFIGRYFLNYLLENQFEIRTLIRDIGKKNQLPNNIEIVIGDITNRCSLNGACSDIDIVFHFAGFAHAWNNDDNQNFSDQHHSINFKGTQYILDEAINAKVKKFILISTVKAVADNQNCVDESWDNEPTSFYGIAKRKAENIVLLAQNTGMHVAVLRPALVYGPKWKGNLDSMLRAIDRGLFPSPPETKHTRSMISVHDVCQASLLAATNPKANGKVYFITDKMNYSTRQIYLLMRNALGKKNSSFYIPFWCFKFIAILGDFIWKLTGWRPPLNSETINKLFSSALYDSSSIENDLGFKPAYSLEKMLPDIVAAYRNQYTRES